TAVEHGRPAPVIVGTPRAATFIGTPASVTDLTDTDGDGLYDSEEQAGWVMTTLSVGGAVTTFHVNSDPTRADTDGSRALRRVCNGGCSPCRGDPPCLRSSSASRMPPNDPGLHRTSGPSRFSGECR